MESSSFGINDESCSICQKSYSAMTRPKVRICNNFHYICYICLKAHYRNKHECPICRTPISKSQIKRDEKIFESICPASHFAIKCKYYPADCNNCGQKGDITMICEKCQFAICSQCHFKYHNQKCKDKERQFFVHLKYPGRCGRCGNMEGKVGTRCKKCKVIFCSDCMKTQRQTLQIIKVQYQDKKLGMNEDDDG